VKVEIDRSLFDTPKPLFWRLRFELRLAAKAAITWAIGLKHNSVPVESRMITQAVFHVCNSGLINLAFTCSAHQVKNSVLL
jgi:hypothetical protein